MLAVLLACTILGSMLVAVNGQGVTSYPVADCSQPCSGDYVCYLCKSGAFKARCFLQSATFPNMVCCTSNANTVTTCDAGSNPKCCDSWSPSTGVIAAIIFGALAIIVILALLAWFFVRRYRQSHGEYDELEGPTPTVYAEQYAAHQKRHRPYSSTTADANYQSTAYGSYQSF